MSDDETDEGPVAESWSPQDAAPAGSGAGAAFDGRDAGNRQVLVTDLHDRRNKAYERYVSYVSSPDHGPTHEYTVNAYNEIREIDRALVELRRRWPQGEGR